MQSGPEIAFFRSRDLNLAGAQLKRRKASWAPRQSFQCWQAEAKPSDSSVGEIDPTVATASISKLTRCTPVSSRCENSRNCIGAVAGISKLIRCPVTLTSGVPPKFALVAKGSKHPAMRLKVIATNFVGNAATVRFLVLIVPYIVVVPTEYFLLATNTDKALQSDWDRHGNSFQILSFSK